MAEGHLLSALLPIIVLLACGVLAALASKELRLSPIVGYIALGMTFSATGMELGTSAESISVLAELGVLFLLFDIGLHFSFRRVRMQAKDIFGFGPAQVLLATASIALPAWLAGLSAPAALLLGATLALSSTAVVARVIAERHQQDCPVGLTATSILVFQDLAGIFILIVATSLGAGTSALAASAVALLKATGCFAASMMLAKVAVRPFLNIIARGENQELFTAIALLVALAAGWVTGVLGLSVTLGAFLGGAMLADSPFRPIIQSEIRPFRGLLLGFFFVSVGLAIDVRSIAEYWPYIIMTAAVLLTIKAAANVGASLLFRWSVPGSVQLAFLLAQGSEFAFVILSLPAMQSLMGTRILSIVVTSVALTLALTPAFATLGRRLAGQLRARRKVGRDPELEPAALLGPVLIVGMDQVGRAVADALIHFDIGYVGMEPDQKRMREAAADGYAVEFGDLTDPRIWEPIALADRRVSVLTAPSLDISSRLTPLAQQYFPRLLRIAVVPDAAQAVSFASVGLHPVIETSTTGGLETVAVVLAAIGVDEDAASAWVAARRLRATPKSQGPSVPALAIG